MRLLAWQAWATRVNRASARQDLWAGLSGALIVLPQGMAYAIIAGLPPQFGLYCAMGPAVLAAVFGSSWHLVSGPTAAISIVVYSALAPQATPGSAHYIQLALTLGLMVGLLQLMIALSRLGRLSDHISHSVIVGFTTGAACLIAASQIGAFLGFALKSGQSFFATLAQALAALPQTQWPVLAVGLTTVLATVAAKRWLPRWPHMVLGMGAGAVLAAVLNQSSVRLVGALPSALPPLSGPSWDFAVWRDLSGSAVAIALLALTEAIAISRAVALRSGQTIDGNQETFGQALSNLGGAFLSAYPSSGSFTRSAVNYEAGAQTPLAAVFAAAWLLAILLLVAPWAAYLPIAAMAGVLFIVAWGLIDLRAIRACWQTRADRAVFLLTFVACLLIQIEWAVLAGIVLATLLGLVRRYKSRGGDRP